MSDPEIGAPEILGADHDLSSLDSGTPVLDDWLRRRALRNQDSDASRTYVIRAGRVTGYHALAVGAVAQAEAPGRTRRDMPDPVPVMVLGRLAVDMAFQGRGLGRTLLRDAVLRPCRRPRSPESGRSWCTRSPRRPGASMNAAASSARRSIP